MKTVPQSSQLPDMKGAVVTDDSMEGARRATGVDSSVTLAMDVPDPEVTTKNSRRRFTASYKLRILKEYESCQSLGEVGKLLRREGLYSSHLTCWRKARDKGQLKALSPKQRGRKPKENNPLATEVAALQKQNKKLEQKLKRAELIIDAQKKISQILGIQQNLIDDLDEGS